MSAITQRSVFIHRREILLCMLYLLSGGMHVLPHSADNVTASSFMKRENVDLCVRDGDQMLL